jgi:hypothetical protein
MDGQTKREIVLIALSTMTAVPVVTGLGFVIVSGIVAWWGCFGSQDGALPRNVQF